jgi:SSS family solute:Na+ symporter
MWAAPLLFPNLPDPTQSYSIMAVSLLPAGLVGAVLASLFAHTMGMTTADINAIAAVMTRDILPVVSAKFRNLSSKGSLKVARGVMLCFAAATLIIAFKAVSFGGIFGLIVLWFGALVGPLAVPMILGLWGPFKRSKATAAILSSCLGIATFVVARVLNASMAAIVATPIVVSLVVFAGYGWFIEKGRAPEKVTELLEALREDTPAPVQSP